MIKGETCDQCPKKRKIYIKKECDKYGMYEVCTVMKSEEYNCEGECQRVCGRNICKNQKSGNVRI